MSAHSLLLCITVDTDFPNQPPPKADRTPHLRREKSNLPMRVRINDDSNMLLLIFASLAVVAAAVVLMGRRERRERTGGDLGSVSQGWIANHRASAYDTTR